MNNQRIALSFLGGAFCLACNQAIAGESGAATMERRINIKQRDYGGRTFAGGKTIGEEVKEKKYCLEH
ncbi:hypothetical protein IQ225_04965 [Synechocystis salina LEGE 06155]|nr:hypothetical protein [Synechocystis salina LEGE 06155]